MARSIAFIIPSLSSGGAERVIVNLANEFAKHNSVYIVTLNKSESFYALDKRVVLLNCSHNSFGRSSWFSKAGNNLKQFRSLVRISDEYNIDCLISFLPSPNVLSCLVSKKRNIPVIISERNNPKQQNLNLFWRLLRWLTYRYASYLVVQTDGIKNYFRKYINPDKLIILPNPLSPELSAYRNINSNFNKENIILNVGRLTEQKAQHIIIKAFSELRTQGWQLVLIGNGPLENKYKSLVKDLNISDKVFFVQKTKNIQEYYSKASIFVLSSIFEGFPNALIEAMHFGLPCISTDCPTGPAEIIQDSRNGFLIPVNDSPKLAERMMDLIDNPDLRIALGEQARIAVGRFEMEQVFREWQIIVDSSAKN